AGVLHRDRRWPGLTERVLPRLLTNTARLGIVRVCTVRLVSTSSTNDVRRGRSRDRTIYREHAPAANSTPHVASTLAVISPRSSRLGPAESSRPALGTGFALRQTPD